MSFNPFLNAKGALYNLYENAPDGMKDQIVQQLLHRVTDKDATELQQSLSLTMAGAMLGEMIFSIFSPRKRA